MDPDTRACVLFEDADRSVTDVTDAWVAAGKPQVSPLREQIRDAVIAQPAMYDAAAAVAGPGTKDELVQMAEAQHVMSSAIAAGRTVPTSVSDLVVAAGFAAEMACERASAS